MLEPFNTSLDFATSYLQLLYCLRGPCAPQDSFPLCEMGLACLDLGESALPTERLGSKDERESFLSDQGSGVSSTTQEPPTPSLELGSSEAFENWLQRAEAGGSSVSLC